MGEATAAGGEVEAPFYKVRYTFRIRGFDKILLLGDEALKDPRLESPTFSHLDTPEVQWSLAVFPLGADKKYVDRVSVFLERKNPPSEGHVAVLAFRAGSHKRDRLRHKFTPEESDRGWPRFMAHDRMTYEEPGVFAVTAEVEYAWGEPKARALSAPPPKQPSLLPLLYSAWLSDFSLEVEGEAVPVHRNILSVASPVFRRMFDQQMSREAQTRTAVLQDTSLPAVKTLLRFAYTGRIDDGEEEDGKDPDKTKVKEDSGEDTEGTLKKTKPAPTAEDVGELCEVLALAHCYDMAGLGRAAAARLRCLLGQATLLPVAAAANLHDFPDLFQACREEVRSGRVELKDWEEFSKAQHDLIPKLTLPNR